MKIATVSEFRAKMKEHLDDVEKDQDVLILSGPKKKDFVLITLEAYNSMEETAHLLSTPANTARLMESIAQDKAGQIAQTIEITEPKQRGKYPLAEGKPTRKYGYGEAKKVVSGKYGHAAEAKTKSSKFSVGPTRRNKNTRKDS